MCPCNRIAWNQKLLFVSIILFGKIGEFVAVALRIAWCNWKFCFCIICNYEQTAFRFRRWAMGDRVKADPTTTQDTMNAVKGPVAAPSHMRYAGQSGKIFITKTNREWFIQMKLKSNNELTAIHLNAMMMWCVLCAVRLQLVIRYSHCAWMTASLCHNRSSRVRMVKNRE